MNKTFKKVLLTPFNLLYKINPEKELKIMFYLKLGYRLNLTSPKTFNEKLNWMKLNYRNDLMPLCSDKFTVREYVKNCGCGHILNELLWEGFEASEIPFDTLPDSFVIKVTHGAGNNIICKKKSDLNIEKTIKKVNKWVKDEYFPAYGEWFYGVIKPRIIVEEFLSEDGNTIPEDYKLYCFNNYQGNHDVAMTGFISGRDEGEVNWTIYDSNWEPYRNLYFGMEIENPTVYEKPKEYDELVKYAKMLSEPFPHARVDFYIINHKVYFGEITFMTGAGYTKSKPQKFDEEIGNWFLVQKEGKF